jgi:hypothetical protein
MTSRLGGRAVGDMASGQGIGGSGRGGDAPGTTEYPPTLLGASDQAASAGPAEHCHFLRTMGPDGRLGGPLRDAALTHRCAAFGEPLPLSLRQQELVCLQRVYVSCPRYLRGALLASEDSPRPEIHHQSGWASKVTAIGMLLLLAAMVLGAALLTGVLPNLRGGPSQVPVAVVTSSPSPSPVPSPSDSASPSASSSPTAGPTPTEELWPTCPPFGDRYVCLKPCLDDDSCYVYMVHVGDKLKEIAYYFGTTVTTIRNWNPWLGPTGTPRPGQTLRIPPP